VLEHYRCNLTVPRRLQLLSLKVVLLDCCQHHDRVEQGNKGDGLAARVSTGGGLRDNGNAVRRAAALPSCNSKMAPARRPRNSLFFYVPGIADPGIESGVDQLASCSSNRESTGRERDCASRQVREKTGGAGR